MRHIYTTNFDSTEGLQSVKNAIDNFSEERFLAALSGKRNVSETDILEMTARVNCLTSRLQLELARLKEYAQHFNSQFVTRDNNRYSTARTLLGKIRSGAAGLKKIFMDFTPGAHRQTYLSADERPLIYDRSAIGNADYTPTLFSEQFPSSVGQLYEALRSFFGNMDEAIGLCTDVMEEEAEIRSDENRCVALYEDFKEDHYPHIRCFLSKIDLSEPIFSSTDNGAIRLRETSSTLGEFSQQGYHNLSFDDVCTLATKELVEKDREGECTKTELWLFRGNKEKILRCRAIIQNFENYLPEKKRVRIPSDMVLYLMIWAKPVEEKAFVRYFTQIYEAAGGQLKVPTNSGVNQRKGFVGPEDPEFAELKTRWDALNLSASQKIA